MNTVDNIEQDILTITEALRTYESKEISGSQLNHLISITTPHINVRNLVGIPYGPGALTAFIDEYLSDYLSHVGPQGGDKLYEIGHFITRPTRTSNKSLWKTFVGPDSDEMLVIDIEKTEIRSELVAYPTSATECTINSVTLDEHDKIREAYLETLDEGVAAKLNELLSTSPKYGQWIDALKHQDPRLLKNWSTFRRQSLKKIFESKLSQLPLDSAAKKQIDFELSASHKAVYKENSERFNLSKPHSPLQENLLNVTDNEQLDMARKLMQSIVNNMGYEDLRSVQLPFGAVLDTLKTK